MIFDYAIIIQIIIFSLDVNWAPIQSQTDRRYLRLTYAESSHMEYTEEWEDRMKLWDEVMADMDDTTTTSTIVTTTTTSNNSDRIHGSILVVCLYQTLVAIKIKMGSY